MMALEIQKIMLEKGLKKKDVADRCGWTPSNMWNKMKRDNFSEEELQKIADALGCTLQISFIDKE